jgi:EAL domain-containing protein (putative c-di-GMP-specific phosphodiesterase class I)
MEVLVGRKIGIISPNLPQTKNAQGSALWFREIEAAFAYLLNYPLDKIYVHPDQWHLSERYQKKILDLNHELTIDALNGEEEDAVYFPTLEEIFDQAHITSLFQPIVMGDKNKIHGYECLSRFTFDERAISPEFIFNYAQEKHSLAKYDRICIELSLKLAPKNSLIFINIRPLTIIAPDFIGWLLEKLKQYDRNVEQVVLEITEQHCHVLEKALTKSSCELRSVGIKLAIDDFGLGLANLSMLEILAPSYLKISGRFSKNIHEDLGKQKIIKNILDLAKSFNIEPVVECVESKLEWLMLKSLGATLAQGFYFYRPMTKEDISS